ncbi:hypothetical protein BGX24_012189 [Mortierella sp. AD032]|nr:hypothetical protein BGX24_012189 [Mortierella sp. AD032]
MFKISSSQVFSASIVPASSGAHAMAGTQENSTVFFTERLQSTTFSHDIFITYDNKDSIYNIDIKQVKEGDAKSFRIYKMATGRNASLDRLPKRQHAYHQLSSIDGGGFTNAGFRTRFPLP